MDYEKYMNDVYKDTKQDAAVSTEEKPAPAARRRYQTDTTDYDIYNDSIHNNIYSSKKETAESSTPASRRRYQMDTADYYIDTSDIYSTKKESSESSEPTDRRRAAYLRDKTDYDIYDGDTSSDETISAKTPAPAARRQTTYLRDTTDYDIYNDDTFSDNKESADKPAPAASTAYGLNARYARHNEYAVYESDFADALRQDHFVYKLLKFVAAFAALFTLLYLPTNSLRDISADNTYMQTEHLAVVTPADNATVNNTYIPASAEYDLTIPYMTELLELFAEHPRAYDIADYIWSYPTKLLELAINNPETIDFVADYPYFGWETYVSADSIDISGDVSSGTIPHFIQWDKRWGYSLYGTEIMGLDGCGPTALAMVAVGLTGNLSFSPRYVADYSHANGYITSGNSSTWTLMSEGSKAFGITAKELILDANAITSALLRSEPIIASMGPGDFTTGGHFIVLTGVTEEGKILIRDPNSYINTSLVWDVKRLMSQMKNLWAFTKAE